MDGRTQTSRCSKMLESLDKKLSMDELRRNVMMHISSNRNSVDFAVKLMFDLEMIKGIDATHVTNNLWKRGDVFK